MGGGSETELFVCAVLPPVRALRTVHVPVIRQFGGASSYRPLPDSVLFPQ